MGVPFRLGVGAAALALFVSGCGGSEEPSRTDDGEVRYYQGFFRQNQLLGLVSFAGGLVYGFYQADFSSPPYPDFAYAGLFVAGPGALSSSGSAKVGQDYRFTTREKLAIALTGFAATDQALTFGIKSVNGTESVYALRATVDELATNVATLPGAYSAQARSTADSLKGTASIGENGDIQAELAGGCQVTGSLASRPKGNLYDASVVFAPGCTLASGSLTGHALQAYGTGNMYVMLTSPAGAAVLLLLVPTATP